MVRPELIRAQLVELPRLLADFRAAVKRRKDKSLASRLEEELLRREPPLIELETLRRLAKWCDTGSIYRDGMGIARQISVLLFDCVLNRREFGYAFQPHGTRVSKFSKFFLRCPSNS
jgi:hypothetical protein